MIPYTLIRLHCTVRRGDIFIVICFHPVSVFFSSGSAGNQDDFSFVRSLSAFCPLVLQAIKTIFPSFGLSLHFVLWFCRQSRRFFLRSVSLCILSSGSAGNQDDFSFVRSLSAFCPLVLQAIKTIFPSFGLSLHFVLWFCRQSRRFFLRSVSLCILSSGSAGNQDDFSFVRSLSAFCPLVLQAYTVIGLHCMVGGGGGGGGGEIFIVIILFSSGLCIFPLVLPAIRMIFFFVRSLHFVLWFCILLMQDDFSFIWSVLYFVILF